MCNRFLVASERVEDLFEALDISEPIDPETWEVRPTDPTIIVARDAFKNRNEVLKARWGFQSRGDGRSKPLINARAESLHQWPAFRESFRNRRCILPVTLFYEFSDTARYRVEAADGHTLAIAGLYDGRKIDGLPTTLCTMITTEPNELIADIHDRMPAILRPEDFEAWLDPRFYDVAALQAMLLPVEKERLRMEYDGPKATARGKAKADPGLGI